VSGAPDAPTNLNAIPLSRTAIVLQWKTNVVTEIDGFHITCSSDGVNFQPLAPVGPDARSYTAANLDPRTTYSFQVHAYNIQAENDYSDTASATTTNDGWENLGNVTVGTSGQMSYVNQNQQFPAAYDYRLAYNGGVVQFDDPFAQQPAKFLVMNFQNGVNPNHMYGDQPYPRSDYGDGYQFRNSAEDAQYDATGLLWAFQHDGGTIGMRFDPDWRSDYTYGSTSWTLQRRIPHAGVQVIGDNWTKEDPDPDAVHPATLMFNRDGREEDDLTLNFSLTGDHIEDIANQVTGTLYYWTPDENGDQIYHSEDYDIASGSVTVPAGTDYAFVDLYAIDDTTPEWTNELNIRLEEDDENYIAEHQFDDDGVDNDGDGEDQDADAVVDIVDNDLGAHFENQFGEQLIQVNNDDDDQDGTADMQDAHAVSGEDDLVELQLDYPQDIKRGATLTLSAPANIRIYDSPDKANLIGPDTFIVGVDTLPLNVWVEALWASTDMGDIEISLTATDATADNPPANPTTTTASDNATAYSIGINWNGKNVSGQLAGDTLIGQRIHVYAEIAGPQQLNLESPTWDITGEIIDTWIANDNYSEKVPYQNPGSAPDTVFVWWKAGSQLASRTEQVTAHFTVMGDAKDINAKFKVWTPIYSLTTRIGHSALNPAQTAFGLYPNTGMFDGMEYTGFVGQPGTVQFDPGTWEFVQLVNCKEERHVGAPGAMLTYRNQLYGQWTLDTRIPVGGTYAANAISAGYLTHTDRDTPQANLPNYIRDEWRSDQFQTYIMYQPPAIGGEQSAWVPLIFVPWMWMGQVWGKVVNPTTGAVTWSNYDGTQSAQASQDASDYPEWTINGGVLNDPWVLYP
jgi:hypothetical protein